MDEREELLVILWRAEEAYRPKRKSFLVMRMRSPSGPLIRHPGLRSAGGDQPFIHRPRADIDDLIEQGFLRQRREDAGGGERWEMDLTDQGRDRARALMASEGLISGKDDLASVMELVDDRIATTVDEEAKARWQAFRRGLDALNQDEARALFRTIRN